MISFLFTYLNVVQNIWKCTHQLKYSMCMFVHINGNSNNKNIIKQNDCLIYFIRVKLMSRMFLFGAGNRKKIVTSRRVASNRNIPTYNIFQRKQK